MLSKDSNQNYFDFILPGQSDNIDFQPSSDKYESEKHLLMLSDALHIVDEGIFDDTLSSSDLSMESESLSDLLPSGGTITPIKRPQAAKEGSRTPLSERKNPSQLSETTPPTDFSSKKNTSTSNHPIANADQSSKASTLYLLGQRALGLLRSLPSLLSWRPNRVHTPPSPTTTRKISSTTFHQTMTNVTPTTSTKENTWVLEPGDVAC